MRIGSLRYLALLGFVLLQGCGGDGSGLTYENPQHVTTKTPFTVEPPKEKEPPVNPYDLNKNDPCFNFLTHEIVRPVATCTKLENGRIKDAFKVSVNSGKLCLLRKSFPNGMSIYTLIGDIQETENNRPSSYKKIDVFGESKLKDDLLTFEMKADDNSFIKYNLREDTVTVRQISKVWKKRRRYFRFSCRPINNISN